MIESVEIHVFNSGPQSHVKAAGTRSRTHLSQFDLRIRSLNSFPRCIKFYQIIQQ